MKNCLICNKKFIPNSHNLTARPCIFCSLNCYWKSIRLEKLEKKCLVCKKKYIQNKNVNRNTFNKSKYCSLKCSAKNRPNYSGKEANHWRGGFIKRNYKLIPGSHTQQEWEELKKKYGYMCLCCKRYEPEVKISKDHIIPITKGGDNSIKNIQPLCRSCNSRKHDKYIDFISNYQINETKICSQVK